MRLGPTFQAGTFTDSLPQLQRLKELLRMQGDREVQQGWLKMLASCSAFRKHARTLYAPGADWALGT